MPNFDAHNDAARLGIAGTAAPTRTPAGAAGPASMSHALAAAQPAAAATASGGVRSLLRPSVIVRNLDVLVVFAGLPTALALGAPAFGVLVGTAGWIVQRVLAVADRRLIVKAAEPGSRLGLNFIDAFARIWLLAGAIVIAGTVGGRRDGLAAALLIFGAYSVALAVRLARGRAGGPG
jgi:hypothetical protein